jgi:ArsR family transcriptional regulator, arsenate/arsenite/antimonite-responsive transcriptional repressor
MRDSQFVKIAKALADPTRHKLLQAVRAKGELTCSDICERFPLSQPTISHHIKTLAEAGLIHLRREGQFHVLTAVEAVLSEFAAHLAPVRARPRRPHARRRPPRKTRA